MDISIVYIVAGLSSRFGGKIKQFARIGPNGETLIEYSLNQALKSGFNKIIFVVGEKTEKPFKEMFGDSYNGIKISYAFQKFDETERDKPWGTTDALCSAKEIIDCPFVVCNGDDIYGEESFNILVNHIKENNNDATVGYLFKDVLPEEGEVNRGVFKVNPLTKKVENLKECIGVSKINLGERELNNEDLCSMNIFALFPDTLKLLSEKLDKFKEKNQGDRKLECFLPTEINGLIKEGKIEMNIYPTKGKWFGVTRPEDEIKVKEELKK